MTNEEDRQEDFPLESLPYDAKSLDKLRSLSIGDKLVPRTKEMCHLLYEFLDVFCWNYPEDLKGTKTLEHTFDLKPNSKPVAKKYYRVTQEKD